MRENFTLHLTRNNFQLFNVMPVISRWLFNLIILVLAFTFSENYSKDLKTLWPSVNNVTRPWTRWWWHGSAVSKEDLKLNMQELKNAGFGGVEITAIYGVKGHEKEDIKFQSPEWMNILEYTLDLGKQIGLGIDVANASGWPFGGPWVSDNDACKNLRYKVYTLKTGEKLNEKIKFIEPPLVRAVNRKVDISEIKYPISSNTNLQELALDQVRFERELPLQLLMAYNEKGDKIDLTKNVDKDGQLNWIAPNGNWKLYAIFIGWHGKMVERASRGGEGNVIDHFSESALKNYLKHFDKNASTFHLNGIRAFFNDSYEVDDAQGQADWTPLLFEEFKRYRKYDLKNYLPALLGDDKEEICNRVICDYRETISDLLLNRFTLVWKKWARKYNALIRNQAHGSPANILDLYAASDIPETEGTTITRIKLATSAANVSGKQLISAEAATWLNEHFLSTLSEVKKNFDRYFANGVNHLVYHGTPYSPFNEEWPGRLFYASVHFAPTNTWWEDLKALNSYVTKCQSFLQNSKPANDILLYYPIYDIWSNRNSIMLKHFGTNNDELPEDLKFISNKFLNEGYLFDFISDKQIQQLSIKNKNIISNNYSEYKTLVIPECNYIPLETFQKILELAKEGATIIFHKNFPYDVPGLFNLENQQKQYQQLKSEIKFVSFANYEICNLGKGKLIKGEDVETILNIAGIMPETITENGIWFNRVNRKEGICYFFTNWSDKDIEQWIKVRSTGNDALWFDPMNNQVGRADIRNLKDGYAEVFVKLSKGETLILQWYSSKQNVERYRFYKETDNVMNFDNEWEIKFLKGGPTLPDSYSTKNLESWTKHSEDLKWFSGTASYKTIFRKPDFTADAFMLDLGKVCESAVVYLNGEKLGTLIGPKYQLIIQKENLKENNVLEIHVTNLMANRIIYMDKNGINYKKFYNINFAAKERKNLDENGLFTAKNWEPLDSGLLGPVKLIGLQFLD